jgi:hypothetical protein
MDMNNLAYFVLLAGFGGFFIHGVFAQIKMDRAARDSLFNGFDALLADWNRVEAPAQIVEERKPDAGLQEKVFKAGAPVTIRRFAFDQHIGVAAAYKSTKMDPHTNITINGMTVRQLADGPDEDLYVRVDDVAAMLEKVKARKSPARFYGQRPKGLRQPSKSHFTHRK